MICPSPGLIELTVLGLSSGSFIRWCYETEVIIGIYFLSLPMPFGGMYSVLPKAC